MTVKSIVCIWSLLSGLKPAKSVEGKLYMLNVKKAIRSEYKAYCEFEKDALDTLRAEGDVDNGALTAILLPEQMRKVDVTLPNMAEEVLMEIMDANPNVPIGAYDELMFE